MRIFGFDQFATPHFLWLLLLVPIYWMWYARFYRPKRLVVSLSYDPEAQYGLKSRRANWRLLPRILQMVAVVLIVMAMARPQSAREWNETRTNGLDIMMLLDVSASMEAEDFAPTRMEAAKIQAVNFIGERPDDRIGLILFAEDALSYAPLTLDHEWLIRLIQGIRFDILPRQGTAIGSAIAVGINRLRDTHSNGKVMVLLTDGANNRGQIDPVTAARLAQMQKMRLYPIGIGNKDNGSEEGTSLVGLDEPLLRQIAEITGGKYFRASDPDQLRRVLLDISRLEKNEFSDLTFREITDRYPWFLIAALLLLCISWGLMLSFLYNPLEQ